MRAPGGDVDRLVPVLLEVPHFDATLPLEGLPVPLSQHEHLVVNRALHLLLRDGSTVVHKFALVFSQIVFDLRNVLTPDDVPNSGGVVIPTMSTQTYAGAELTGGF